MSTEVYREQVVGNWKPSRTQRMRSKKSPAAKRKNRPGNSEQHLKLLRTLPCCIPGCRRTSVEVHHLKATGARGMGMKSPDKYCVPLCTEHHINGVETIGTKNELKWFRNRGIEALELASALWSATPNPHAMYRVLIAHKNADCP